MKLIFGANGKLGTDFKELFDSIGEKYIAIDKDELDITNGDFLRAYIKTIYQNYKIDTIINCAAYNDVDKAETEKELCYKLNAEAPANLAMIASEIGATFITYSTDFVFNGITTNYLYDESTGYTEEDEPHPLSTYAKAKHEGELLVSQVIENTENTSRIYIVRTSWLFGKGSMNFIDKIIETGVDSLKIEGRMKSIYYNSTVVKQYKRALDNYYSGNYKYDPDWLAELKTISHRQYSNGFYLGPTSEKDQNYETGLSYSQTYRLVANVLEKVDTNKYKIQIRNKVYATETLELVRPIGDAIKFKVENFFNTKNEEYQEYVNPNTIAIIETDVEMGPMDLIRIKLPEGQSDSDMDTSEF